MLKQGNKNKEKNPNRTTEIPHKTDGKKQNKNKTQTHKKPKQ